jgi:hypothetical protein
MGQDNQKGEILKGKFDETEIFSFDTHILIICGIIFI